jgi:hypothetical protein
MQCVIAGSSLACGPVVAHALANTNENAFLIFKIIITANGLQRHPVMPAMEIWATVYLYLGGVM